MKTVGMILGLHKGREKGDWVVLNRLTPNLWPDPNIEKIVKEHQATGAYSHIWFIPVNLPKGWDE